MTTEPLVAATSERRPPALFELTAARFREFWREPGAIFWTFGFPLLLTVALGIAFRNTGPSKIAVAVVDGPGAAQVVAHLSGTRLTPSVVDSSEAQNKLRHGDVSLIIDASQPQVTYFFDPQRPEAGTARLLADDALQRAAGRADLVPVKDETRSAPGARYVDWLVPGLLGLQLMSGSMWGMGWSIVQTRQRRLLRRLAATPMRRTDYLLAFLFSRLFFVLAEIVVLLGFAYLAFGVEVRGSLPAVALLSVLGAGSFAGVALLCASRAQNAETASGLINLVMMPMFVLSGVFFSAANFPKVIQPALRLLPLTALNDALRAVINSGASIATLGGEMVVLAVWGSVCFALALRIFRWT